MTIPIRSKIEVVCEVELQEAIVSAILETAQTGEPDDGKIFIDPSALQVAILLFLNGAASLSKPASDGSLKDDKLPAQKLLIVS